MGLKEFVRRAGTSVPRFFVVERQSSGDLHPPGSPYVQAIGRSIDGIECTFSPARAAHFPEVTDLLMDGFYELIGR